MIIADDSGALALSFEHPLAVFNQVWTSVSTYLPTPRQPRPLLTVRSATVLLGAVVAVITAAALTLMAGHSPAEALLRQREAAGRPSCCSTPPSPDLEMKSPRADMEPRGLGPCSRLAIGLHIVGLDFHSRVSRFGRTMRRTGVRVRQVDGGREKTRGHEDARPVSGRDDAIRLVTVANVALVGIPAAYSASRSVLITVVAGAAAIVLVIAHLLILRREPPGSAKKSWGAAAHAGPPNTLIHGGRR